MKALQLKSHGPPAEALQLVNLPDPQAGRADVVCSVLASPINPTDLLTVRGFYPILPTLPNIGGMEGVGRVETVGSAITALSPGQHVLLPVRGHPWAEKTVVKAVDCIPLPDSVDPSQACMIRINALTARVLLSEFRLLNRGDWIIQNPGSSSVGQYVIQIAEMMGLKTVNIVRRPERAEYLKSLGAHAVLLDGPDLPKRVKEATAGAEIALALDGIGGAATDRMAGCLMRGGLVVCYGAVSRSPAELSVLQSIFRGIRLRGFWLYPWKRKDMERTRIWLKELVDDFEASRLITEIAAEFPLERWEDAFELAASPNRNGRVVLCPTS